MPTTSSTTSLVAGGAGDLGDDQRHSRCLHPSRHDTADTALVVGDVALNITSKQGDRVLAVSGGADAPAALSEQSAHLG
ncbi:hypothetical protein C8R43DRAFT_1130195 [Mycena crocata]|nr:hypothetical protein C8R43DRAFT_1130195 [Mycena crocata]